MKPAAERWTTQYPELDTLPVPVEPYVSPEYFDLERERIFKRLWLTVGRVDEIPKGGDYFIKDIEVSKTSVLVVRGRDGAIRGFHNLCRHRGNKVVKACAGSTGGFSCGFHGWTYDLEGRLVYVPDEDQFYDLKKSEHGLTPIATDVWKGFIFINADVSPTETLEEFMGELGEQLSEYPFEGMQRVAMYSADVNVNWKVLLDAFQETYHGAVVHKRSAPDASKSKDNPFIHLLWVKLYRHHHMASVYANPEHQPTAAESLAFKYGPTLVQGTEAKDALPPGVNPSRSPYWAFDEDVIFPNFFIAPANGWYFTYNFWPVAVNRTLWELKVYMNQARNAGEKISQEFSKVLLRDLTREDLNTLEDVQKGLASGALTHIQLSDQEILIRHSQKVVEDFVGAFK